MGDYYLGNAMKLSLNKSLNTYDLIILVETQMVDFFVNTYMSIIDKNRILKKIRYYSLLRVITRVCANLFIPTFFLLTQKDRRYSLYSRRKNGGRIIVSLTSFPNRIDRVWLVIETILRQTKKPDKIILWLSNEQFSNLDVLPIKLLKQRERGLEIKLEDGNIRSYKKYFYTFKEFPNDYIITIDDDIFYRSRMIEEMYNQSLLFPTTIIAQYCREMKWIDGCLESYTQWPAIKNERRLCRNAFFGTGGGALIPPGTVDEEVVNLPLFLSLSPTADDVWLNAMCKLRRTRITVLDYHSSLLPVLNLRDVTLHSINIGLDQNSEQIGAVSNYFELNRGIDPFSEQQITE